ncbi:MAG: anthranilate phosphoribosyltransferase [Gammaproteobacteria bacterium]
MKLLLEKISRGRTLTSEESYSAMQFICSTQNENAKIAAFLAILHNRGETKDEILGFIKYIREQSLRVNLNDASVIDVCGTGGDHAGSFNISTTAALLLASAGVKVAKHGGRSVSSQCGFLDVVEALDLPLCNTPIDVATQINQHQIAFISAGIFNPVFKKISALRKELGIRTVFNLLGPLVSPVDVKRQVIGVYDKKLLQPVAEILMQLNCSEAMIIHSFDGLDEISISAPTNILHLRGGMIEQFTITPEQCGLSRGSLDSIKGGNAAENAVIIQQIFCGQQGPRRDVVVLNAAAGFVVAGKTNSINEGVLLANEIIDSGQAEYFLKKLNQAGVYEKSIS